ncbi:hypothetical protein SAMN05421780_102201 [Flexibacter flexilis DSM 6793]|uniref:Uncharacterized protein n=1 Tax=Flexibacter flexilis DSM 6793 TaxID=927664 RepID=A0A1I1FJ63_9BACT|nr:hypothetical protein [Flexibacter flexilis]SFB99032.1 hypothetical protein SAMN05421780_102201 [Flexibacter flexilis DSM 6793]
MTDTIIESGMTFVLPQGQYFRFEEAQAYQSVKAFSVTEMDLCYVEGNTLFLVELKRFYDPSNPKFMPKDISVEAVIEDLKTNFYKNAWHSLAMLAQNRSNTQTCMAGLRQPIDFEKCQIKLIFILNIAPNKDILPLYKEIAKKLTDVKALFRVDSVAVLDYDTAKDFYPNWIK